jgi:hypothetical protein
LIQVLKMQRGFLPFPILVEAYFAKRLTLRNPHTIYAKYFGPLRVLEFPPA